MSISLSKSHISIQMNQDLEETLGKSEVLYKIVKLIMNLNVASRKTANRWSARKRLLFHDLYLEKLKYLSKSILRHHFYDYKINL